MLRALLALGAVLVVCAPAVAHPAARQSSATARLRLMDPSPATAQGAGFQSRAVVRVVLTAGGTATARRVVATGGGRFSATWTNVTVDVCGTWQLKATGDKGSRALLHSRPHICPPPPPTG